MVQYKLKTLATTALSSALIVSTLSGFTTSVEAATKVQKAKDVKFKKGKLVKKSNGQVIKGYVSYKGVVYKNGNTFTGILNKYYFKKGKKATGLYKSKYYKNGSLGTGIYKKYYYKVGSLGTGTYKGKKYVKGKLLTGLSGNIYYKNGVLGTGSYQGKKYVKGKLFSGLSSNLYYKDGVLGTGLHGGHYYVKGKLGSGEFKGILYEAGKVFTGEKNGIIYKDGKKDENQTNIANFKKAETAVQQAHNSFKKVQEQKAALEQLAKQVNLSPNTQTEGSGDIDAFLTKYKDVDVSKFTSDELTNFKDELNKHIALANENSITTSTSLTNAVNTFIAATNTIASTTDNALLTHIKKAVAAATSIVASLKTTGYDTLQLENALSKLPGGTPTGNGGSNSGGGSSTPGGGGGNEGESDEVIAQKLDDLSKAQKAVEEKQIAYDELFALQKEGIEHVQFVVDEFNKPYTKKIKLKQKNIIKYYSPASLEEFKSIYPDSGYIFNAKAFEADVEVIYNIIRNHLTPVNDELIEANAVLLQKIQSLSNTKLQDDQKRKLLSAILLSEVSIDSLSWSPQNVESLKKVFNTIPDSAKPNHTNREEIALDAVNQLFDSNYDEQKLAQNITQAQINATKKLANSLTESAVKEKMLQDIEDAQTLFDRAMSPTSIENATNALNALFNDDGQTLTENIEQKEIDYALYLIKKIPGSEAVKTELLSQVQKAQVLFATKKVNSLLDDDQVAANITEEQIVAAKIAVSKLSNENTLKETFGNTLFKVYNSYNTRVISDFTHSLLKEDKLADDVDQAKIDKARKLLDDLPYGSTVKPELEALIHQAQDLLDKKMAPINATNTVHALFNEGGTELAAHVNQENINHARSLIESLPDDSGEETTKKDLIDQVNKAQNLFITQLTQQIDALVVDGQIAPHATKDDIFNFAYSISLFPDELADVQNNLSTKLYHAFELFVEKKVNALFNGDNLADGVNEARLGEVIELLQNLENSPKINELIEKFLKAQDLFVANKVNNLFVADSNDTELALGVDEEHIMKIEELLVKVKDEDLKAILRDRIDHAYFLLSV